MDRSRDLALLLKVNELVTAEGRRKPRYQPNGGNTVHWPFVGMVMDWLRPGNDWAGADRARNRFYRATRGMTEEAKAALAASVQMPELADIVRQVMDRGMRPAGRPPKLSGEPEDREPTPEEVIAQIRRESDLSDEEAAEESKREIEMERLKAKARVASRLAQEYLKKAAFVTEACAMLRDIVVTMPEARWSQADVPAVHIRREQDAVLVISDIHIGDAIHADTMGAINVYNFDIFKQKAKRLYAGVRESLDMLREHGNVRRIKVLGLGDWVTGTNIFPGQAHHIEFGAMKQAVYGADELVNLYYELLELPGIEEVDAEHVPGNHGRPGKKGQDPFEDNWDLVLFEFLRLRLANQPRLKFQWHPSWWMMPRIRGWDFLCAHGDEVRAWNGIPNYGFRRWGAKWREMLDSIGKRYDYGLIGHHHTEVEERNLIISGAWPGASFFSAKFLQSGGEATQMFYSVSEDYGITWRRRLPLDPPKRGEEPAA